MIGSGYNPVHSLYRHRTVCRRAGRLQPGRGDESPVRLGAGATSPDLWGQKTYDDTLADFTAAILIDPTYGRYYALRADLLRLMEEYSEALTDANQAVALTPDDEFAWGVRGYVYRMLENYEEAITNFTQAIALAPTYGWGTPIRGELYQLLERDADALADFEQANSLNGSAPLRTPSPTATPAPTAAATPEAASGTFTGPNSSHRRRTKSRRRPTGGH